MVNTGRIASAATLAAAFVLLPGCSSSDGEQASEDTTPSPAATGEPDGGSSVSEVQVTFDGSSCSYTGPGDVSPGIVGVDVVNDSETGVGALLLRLTEDATFDDFVAAHQPEPYLGEPLDIAEPSGAVGRVQPGDSGSSTFPVETGDYVLLCLVDADDPDNPASYLAQPAGVTVTG
jgi:hypothetical protein